MLNMRERRYITEEREGGIRHLRERREREREREGGRGRERGTI